METNTAVAAKMTAASNAEWAVTVTVTATVNTGMLLVTGRQTMRIATGMVDPNRLRTLRRVTPRESGIIAIPLLRTLTTRDPTVGGTIVVRARLRRPRGRAAGVIMTRGLGKTITTADDHAEKM